MIANNEPQDYAFLMLLMGAVFVLIVAVTYFIPIVLPGLLIVTVGAGASMAVSKMVFHILGATDRTR